MVTFFLYPSAFTMFHDQNVLFSTLASFHQSSINRGAASLLARSSSQPTYRCWVETINFLFQASQTSSSCFTLGGLYHHPPLTTRTFHLQAPSKTPSGVSLEQHFFHPISNGRGRFCGRREMVLCRAAAKGGGSHLTNINTWHPSFLAFLIINFRKVAIQNDKKGKTCLKDRDGHLSQTSEIFLPFLTPKNLGRSIPHLGSTSALSIIDIICIYII